MPIKRKLTIVGNSRGVTLPKSWIDSTEEQAGHRIKEVYMKVDGVIVIAPVLKREEAPQK